MKTFPRLIVALFALAFVVAACSSGSGPQWTAAPLSEIDDGETPTETMAPEEPAEPAEPEAPAEPTEPEAPAEPEEPVAPPSGEARVIELQADSALRFTDMTGQPVTDIPVTPGETVLFRVDNTAGFAHNLYIGTDAELSVPSATTDVGIPDWTTGVQELEWVVPADITDLKFACTVPGHYFSMQGTFSSAAGAADAGAEPEAPADEVEPEAPAEPAEPEEAAEPADAEAPADGADAEAPADGADTEEAAEPAEASESDEAAAPEEPAAAAGEARVIELEADAAIRFLQDGQQIVEIPVTPGETVLFRVDNTAGFAHNLYIGADEDLRVMGGTTDVGIPDWNTGVQELEWVVPDDITDIRFACTVPGHYFTMQGDFVISQ